MNQEQQTGRPNLTVPRSKLDLENKNIKNKGKIACQAPKPPNFINPNHLAVAF
jgi:hypothetical protein